jgi:hypothetical protein
MAPPVTLTGFRRNVLVKAICAVKRVVSHNVQLLVVPHIVQLSSEVLVMRQRNVLHVDVRQPPEQSRRQLLRRILRPRRILYLLHQVPHLRVLLHQVAVQSRIKPPLILLLLGEELLICLEVLVLSVQKVLSLIFLLFLISYHILLNLWTIQQLGCAR